MLNFDYLYANNLIPENVNKYVLGLTFITQFVMYCRRYLN